MSSFITARTTADFMYRGSDFALSVSLFNERGEHMNVPEGATAEMRLSRAWMDAAPLLVKPHSYVVPGDGVFVFQLVPADTADLAVGGYDLSVILYLEGKPHPLLTKRFGLEPVVGGVSANYRDLESLIRLIREELRAEGPDGGGFSDLFVQSAINRALGDLAGVYPIKDTVEFLTTGGTNKYSLGDMLPEGTVVENILRVTYNDIPIIGTTLDSYLVSRTKTEGFVRGWLLWANDLLLVGEIEDEKIVQLWLTRAPRPLRNPGEIPETPYYADEAIMQYAIAACYRESKDYDRANYHYSLYMQKKGELAQRGTPQGQRGVPLNVTSGYFPPVTSRGSYKTSDTNPGGR